MTTPTKCAPAFDFYPERWTHGTRHMTKTERCDYLDLLCHQWTENGLPDDLDMIARLLGYKKPSQIPPLVLEKFPVSEDGRRRNQRLESERVKQIARIDKKRYGASITNQKRWGERPRNESHSDRIATPERVANESPPPTTVHPPPLLPPNPPRGAVNGAGITEGTDSKNIPTTEQSKRIAKIFHRREKTPWQTNEVRAYKKIGTIPDEDLAAVEAYYAANWPPCRDKNILRHDLLTFLNNFQGEVGRAYAAKEKPTTKPDEKRQHLHSNGATGLANAPGRYDTHGPSFRERLANLEPAPQIPGLQPAAGPHPG